MHKRIIKFFYCGLMIFKILTVGLPITAYDGICLHSFALCNYNQVRMFIYVNICPNVHTAKQMH